MTDEKRCEPPPEWRDRDGWHWVELPDGFQQCVRWWRARGQWGWAQRLEEMPWRYLAPVTSPATVAALVEALEGIQALSHQVWCDMQGRLLDDEHKRAHVALFRLNCDARAALSLYRGEGKR